MAIFFGVTKGNGTGKCKICGKKIKKNSPQVVAEGFQDSSRAHVECIEKKIKKLKEKK